MPPTFGTAILPDTAKLEIVAYEDLGTEAIRRLEVENFPAIVTMDSHGKSLHAGQGEARIPEHLVNGGQEALRVGGRHVQGVLRQEPLRANQRDATLHRVTTRTELP